MKLIQESGGRTAFEIQARGSGLVGGITPQTLIPHGQTPSIYASAMVKSNLQASPGDGVSHSIQGFVRGPTGAPVRVWQNGVLDTDDESKWMSRDLPDYSRITFIDQMPDQISPEWIESWWVVRGSQGKKVWISDLELRDHYSRRYAREIGAAEWTSFANSIADDWLSGRSALITRRYIDTITTYVAQGQSLTFEVEAFIDLAQIYKAGVASPSTYGFALKCNIKDSFHSDWVSLHAGATDSQTNSVVDGIVYESKEFMAKNSYDSIDLVAYFLPIGWSASLATGARFDHSGVKYAININDSLVTGS